MTDTITRLLAAVAARDAKMFPKIPDGVSDHDTFAYEYLANMMRDLLRQDENLDQFFEHRISVIEGDLK